MSRLIAHTDMTADQLIDVSYDIMAILTVADAAAKHIETAETIAPAWAVSRLMRLALELHGPLHDALEMHERPATVHSKEQPE